MRIAVAELIDKEIPGGEFNDDVPLGKLYTIDLDSVSEGESKSASGRRPTIKLRLVLEYPTGKVIPFDALRVLVA